jgi:hypothetical protein
MCDRFREKVISREIDESVKLKFYGKVDKGMIIDPYRTTSIKWGSN